MILLLACPLFADLNFEVIALGHSGLLVYWDSNKANFDEKPLFLFVYQEILEKSNNTVTTIDLKRPSITSDKVRSDVGQY